MCMSDYVRVCVLGVMLYRLVAFCFVSAAVLVRKGLRAEESKGRRDRPAGRLGFECRTKEDNEAVILVYSERRLLEY